MKPTRKLNSNQHITLLLTHKFRFVPSSLLAAHRSINQSSSRRTLGTLRTTGYLNRHYDKTYKLQGKSARYYLSKQGIQYLKANTDTDPLTLNLHYKNKNMGQAYIDHCIDTYSLYLRLIQQYPNHEVFSRIELSRDEDHLDPKPDLYLQASSEADRSIFVDIFSNTQTWVIKKRIDQYLEHYEEEWEEDEYPSVFIYVASTRLAEQLNEYVVKRMDDLLIEDGEISINLTMNAE